MSRLNLKTAALAAATLCIPATNAFAHCAVGNRFFPATINVDDPCVADELSLPTVASFKNGDDPSARELDISGEISKRITENLGVSFGKTWVRLRGPGGETTKGWDNLESSIKYQFLTDPASEFVMSASLDVDWGGTGSDAIGEPFTTLTPTLFLGKGFGFLSDDMKLLRPLAFTAQLGYSIPTDSRTEEGGDFVNNPRSLVWGGSIQYSMPYLKSSVEDMGYPDFVNRLIPIVEWSMNTEVSNFSGDEKTTGTINPGVLYIGDSFQLGLEAIIPVNRASGDGVGVVGQLHLYMDDIFPNSYGRPLLETSRR